MPELTNVQQAMCYQALYNALGPVVKANGDGLRGDVDREMRQLYEQTGAKSFKIRVGDTELGTYSVNENKAVPEQPESTKKVLDMVNLGDFNDWFEGEDAQEMIGPYMDERELFMDFCEWYISETGEIPSGVEVREVVIPAVPAKPASYKGGTIRVDKAFQQEVQKRMGDGLAALVAPAAALLPEGE